VASYFGMIHAALFLLLAHPVFVQDYRPLLEAQMKKAITLAEATPEEEFGYRPTPSVRSTREVFLHIANGNRILLKSTQGASGKDLGEFFEKTLGLEKTITKKAEILAEMRAPLTDLEKVLDAETDATLLNEISWFGEKKHRQSMWMFLTDHLSEHLGQSIANARANGVKPPWAE
jgi:uncharacterized damage-inducible protein DinB